MSIDHSAAALQAALRAFGETLGRALSEGITQGLQEGLSQSLDLDQLAQRAPAHAAEGAAAAVRPAPRRGGRPRGEVRPCKLVGCTDPARSRGLCSRHYQQELRREKAAQAAAAGGTPMAPPPAPETVEARPPIVRKREQVEATPEQQPVASPAPAEPVVGNTWVEEARREIHSPTDAARRIFG